MYRVKVKKSHPCLEKPEIRYKEFELLEDALEYADNVSEVLFQSIETIRAIVEEKSSDGVWTIWKDKDGYTSDEYTMVNDKMMRIL